VDLNEARRLEPGSREPLEGLGRLADRRGNPAQAAVWYSEAASPTRLAVADPKLLYALALARFRSGAPAAAIEPLKRALTRDPNIPEAHFLLGLASRDAGLPDEAAEAFGHAIRLDSTLLAARAALADLYYEQRMVADEVVARRALAALEPTADRYVDLALACLRASRPDDALAALAQAEGDDPGSSRVALAYGRVHLAEAERLSDPSAARRALAALERALGGTARRSEGLALFGRALFLVGDVAQSERLLKDAVLTSPVDPEAYAFLADSAERLGHHAAARDALLSLAALQGDTAPNYERLRRARRIGALSLLAGDPEKAVEQLEIATKGGQPDAQTYALLARARAATGDRDGARSAISAGLALSATNPELLRLSRTLR
jgi:predicted Zn-dependent protease